MLFNWERSIHAKRGAIQMASQLFSPITLAGIELRNQDHRGAHVPI